MFSLLLGSMPPFHQANLNDFPSIDLHVKGIESNIGPQTDNINPPTHRIKKQKHSQASFPGAYFKK
jgi:hypothetical protein